MSEVKSGDMVEIHYTGKFEDGSVFDSSEGREPLKFSAGSAELIPGVSQAVLGMNVGDSKTVSVPPEQGYGQREEGLDRQVPRESLPEQAQVGDPLQAEVGEQMVLFWVMELDDEFAVVDANHPLAGKTLVFDIELVSVGA